MNKGLEFDGRERLKVPKAAVVDGVEPDVLPEFPATDKLGPSTGDGPCGAADSPKTQLITGGKMGSTSADSERAANVMSAARTNEALKSAPSYLQFLRIAQCVGLARMAPCTPRL